MKIRAYVVTIDETNYPDAPDYSSEFDVKSVEDLVSHAEIAISTFNGIHPDRIMINAWDEDDKNSFDDTIFRFKTTHKGETLNDVIDVVLKKIRERASQT